MLEQWKRLWSECTLLLHNCPQCVQLVTSLNQLSHRTPPSAHLKPAPILLYEIIVHSTDHPLVFIQDLCLKVEKEHSVIFIFTFSTRDFKNTNLKHDTVQTYRMHIDQPPCFLPRLLHPVEPEAGVHLVGELAALQPLEGGHGGSIVPGSKHKYTTTLSSCFPPVIIQPA